MKVKAIYNRKIRNPFIPDINQLVRNNSYSKTVEVPDDTDMDVLRKFAEEDALLNFELSSIEKVDDSTPVSPLKYPDEEESNY